MRKNAIAAVLMTALSVLCLPAKAQAQDPVHKAGRGIINVMTFWVELPKQIHLGSAEENPFVGFGRGIIRGVGLGVIRLGVGLYEVLTFPLEYPKEFASPYEGMELGDYAWE